MEIKKSPVKLYASIKAVIALYLNLSQERNKFIVERIGKLSEAEIDEYLEKVKSRFGKRHRNLDQILSHHFSILNESFHGQLSELPEKTKMITGAYFTKEYSFQSAALFNPSIVAHPDQANVPPGASRFIMSLRATGEGHISSIAFQTGIVTKE